MRFPFVLALVLTSTCCRSPRPSEVHSQSFHFNGELVHPGAVQLLVGILADPLPVVAAVDLEGWSKSEDWEPAHILSSDSVSWRSNGERFNYSVVGRTASGTFVLQTQSSSDTGSGVFENLVFVRLESVTYREADELRTQHLIRAVGGLFIGDRQYPVVSLTGTRVVLRPSDSPWSTLEAPVEVAVE